MEFPECGSNCSKEDCKQLDFLPITCNYCSQVFCKDHIQVTIHSCSKYIENVSLGTEKTVTYDCVYESCKTKTQVEMKCEKCNKNFCLLHRHHGCFEISKEEILSGKKKLETTKQKLEEAKSVVDQQITKNLKKAKNSSMANKIQLMKLKNKSIGSNNIPTTNRQYFLVHLPITLKSNSSEKTKGVFVDVNWSVGKVIDSIADLLKIPNSNNISTAVKLNMFHHATGLSVANAMDITLTELLQSEKIINGQDIILEYCDKELVDYSLYL